MKLHANAALTLRQRRRMVRLVVDEQWPLAAAAAPWCAGARRWSRLRSPRGPSGLRASSVASARDVEPTEPVVQVRWRRVSKRPVVGAAAAAISDGSMRTVSAAAERAASGMT